MNTTTDIASDSQTASEVEPSVATAIGALAHPQRVRIVAELVAGGRQYVSELARRLRMNRPLLHMHLQRLQAAGLVRSSLEVSADGKAQRYYETVPFDFHITPASIAEAAGTAAATTDE